MSDAELLIGRLTHRFTKEQRPLALVVGSALSQQGGRGVAGVREVVATGLARHPEIDTDQSLVRALESSVVDLGDIYRQFMGRLIKARGRAAADDLVRLAVLRAWQGSAEPSGDGLLQKDLGGWQLTDALVSLADIIKARPSAVPVIVTTNFDPLVEVALRRNGIPTTRRVVTADASLRDPGHHEEGAVRVVYVHGFWHKAPTMHTQEQLMYSRPRLHSALVATLKTHDVLVVGYGGWDDVITGALESLTMDDGASAEVLWAFFESDPAILQTRNRTLLGRVGRLIIEGLFHQYAGVDCHKVFPELARRLDASAVQDDVVTVGSAPSGWVVVDDALITGARALYSEQALRSFFDGRTADWALASSPTVPTMSIVDNLSEPLLNKDTAGSLWQFVVAPAGDGKSTAVMQAGYQLLQAGWRVIWRPHPGVSLEPQEFLALIDETPTVVLIDDADNCARALYELASMLTGTRSLQVIAAARLSDWRHADFDLHSITNVTAVEVQIAAMSRREGRELVGAWASIPNGLGHLVETPDGESRLERLLDAVASDRRSNGSLLGGLFRLRYDKAGLDAHVNDLLDSLERRAISGSHVSLLKAFIYICAIEVAGLEGIDRRLWAELLGVDVKSLRRTVEFNLGAEAATARAGGLVQVRHPELATSAIRLLLSRDRGLDLRTIYSDIVSSTINLGKLFDLRNYSKVVHLSTRLPDALISIGYRRELAFAISLGAAEASVQTEPNLLVYQTDYGSLLRKAGKANLALDSYSRADARVASFRDRRRAEQGFYFDFALAYSEAGDPLSSLLVNIFAWTVEPVKSPRDCGRYLVQISKNFLRMYEASASDRARLALAGIVRIADLIMPSAEDYDWCCKNAKAGYAPSASALEASQAIELVEKGLTIATKGCAAEETFGAYKAGSLEALTSHVLRN